MLFLHRVSIRTLYEPLVLCRLRSSRRSDAASFESASLRAQPRAQSSGLGVVATVQRLTSGGRFVERHVDLLRDPDSMQQYGKLPGDGHHSSPSGVASASGTQTETPSSQGRVFAVWPDDVVGTFNQQLSQVSITCFGDAKLRVAVAGLTAPRPQAEITADIPTSLEAFL